MGLPGVDMTLAGCLCVLPFLLPYNQIFEAEWLAGAFGVAAALAALVTRGVRIVALPALTRWLAAFALFIGAQALVVYPVYLQIPATAALYVLYAALMTWLGAQVAAPMGMERAATVLATWLLAGALANAAAGVIQFYGRPALFEDIVAELPYRAGAWGNIGQQNLYANYLALGAAALIFLWSRGRARTGYASAATALLACAAALSGSRTSVLYALWFALLGMLAERANAGVEGRCLKFAAFTMAATMLAAQVAIPWLNGRIGLGNVATGALERLLPSSIGYAEPRWQIWLLAWRMFSGAPLAGTGIGEFAGAAFRAGLSPSLTHFGNEVWTSPHNLLLQLLAETGAAGAFLALAGVVGWCWQIGRRYVTTSQPALWWIIAAAGIELIHSMFEFPLWNAHFLGLTALLMGLGAPALAGSRAALRVYWSAAAAIVVVLALALAMSLRDYAVLLATRITGTTLTLASRADAARDAAAMQALRSGPFAPAAEFWIITGAKLDRNDLHDRLEMSARVARHYPAHAVIVRRAVFLAFNGDTADARRVLEQAMYTFPKRCGATIRILAQALPADPGAIGPLLSLAKRTGLTGCN